MTTPQDNKLTAFLEEMKEIGEKATPGPWSSTYRQYDTKEDVDDMVFKDKDGAWMGHSYGDRDSSKFTNSTAKNNTKFIATARNNWDKLIKMNEVLLEACKFSEKALDAIKYDLNAGVYTLEDDEFETVFTVRDNAHRALQECEEMIKESGE